MHVIRHDYECVQVNLFAIFREAMIEDYRPGVLG